MYYFRYPVALGCLSYFGKGEVITYEDDMFARHDVSDSLADYWSVVALHYNKPFLRNLLTTPVRNHQARVFKGVPFFIHTQLESIDPEDLFDDMEFFPAWIGTLYAWERYAVDFGEPFTYFLPDSFTFRYVLTPGGNFSVGPVSGDLDSALLTLAVGEIRTPHNWRRFLSESDRLHAPWISPEPMQSLLGMALAREIEHLAQNSFCDDLTYLHADKCSDSTMLSTIDSTLLGFENRPYTFENRTGKPIWLLSSAIKHYRGSRSGYGTSCWWEFYPIFERPDWEYRRRGNLLWSCFASDDMADTTGEGSRGFGLNWFADSASAIYYSGHFMHSGAGTLFVADSPIAVAGGDTSRWFAIDYLRDEFTMNSLIVSRYFDSELRLAVSADNIWTIDVWEIPGGIADNPAPRLLRLPTGATIFPGGGTIDVSPSELAVYSSDSTAFVVHSLGPETLHVGWIGALKVDITPQHAIIAPGDSMVFWASYDGIALVHDTIRIYSDDPQTPMVKVYAMATYGIAETLTPRRFEVYTYPNPFNSAVTITIDIPVGDGSPVPISVEIYDVSGRRIDVIARSPQDDAAISPNQGDCHGLRHRNDGAEIVWQPSPSITSGIYLVRATVGDEPASKRIVYLR